MLKLYQSSDKDSKRDELFCFNGNHVKVNEIRKFIKLFSLCTVTKDEYGLFVILKSKPMGIHDSIL